MILRFAKHRRVHLLSPYTFRIDDPPEAACVLRLPRDNDYPEVRPQRWNEVCKAFVLRYCPPALSHLPARSTAIGMESRSAAKSAAREC